MKAEGYLFGLLAVFLGGMTLIYWFTSKDPTGTTALALSAGLGTLIGYYALFLSRRMRPRPSDRGDADIAEGAGELGFFSPHSWWPLIAALASAIVMLGLIFGWWLFVIGVVAQLAGVTGILFQYEGRTAEYGD
ncbi:MAG: cytochrome c oxidase subunit 4 [Actinomycetes bacterium]